RSQSASTGASQELCARRGFCNIPNLAALIFMSRAQAYRAYAAECIQLARNAFSAQDRRNLSEMSAAWRALADKVEKREGDAKSIASPPQPQPEANPAPGPAAAQPEKLRMQRTSRKGSPTGRKPTARRAHSTRSTKSRA